MSMQLMDVLRSLGVSEQDWENAVQRSRTLGEALDRVVDARELAAKLGLRWVDSLYREPSCPARDVIPEHLLNRWQVVPLELSSGTLVVVASAPLEPEVLRQLEQFTGAARVEVRLAQHWEVREASRPRMRAQVTTGARRAWHPVGTTFAVAEVEPATKPLAETATWNVVREQFHPLEACSDIHAPMFLASSGNALIQAAYLAFTGHRPLVLSPDILWLTILYGVSQHISNDPERLRSNYVSHLGKVRLTVERDDFVLGSPENPWEEIFESFDGLLGEHLSEQNHRFFQADFSTSGPVERAAARVMAMSALRSYFEYEVCCICGIPSITLEGTPADWRRLQHRVGQLEQHDLGAWRARLEPILARFVRASEGEVDRAFWRDLFQMHDPDTEAYGGPIEYFSGWISEFCTPEGAPDSEPLPVAYFPPVIGVAPLKWRGRGEELDMEFCAGLLGVEQRLEDCALRPKVGWVVRRADP